MSLIELTPIIICDGKILREHEEYKVQKNDDKSVNIFFNEKGFNLKFKPSILEGGIPSVYINNTQMDFSNYVIRSLHIDNKPGVEINFKDFVIRKLILVPRVMEESEYRNRVVKEKKSQYQKEHGFLFK